MKKSHLLLPLVAVLGLAGCSSSPSSTSTDGSSDESQIAETVDAAASNAGISNDGWVAADITPATMPSSMNQTAPARTPNYGRVTASAPAPSAPQPAPVASTASPTPAPAPQPSTAGNCGVVRDSAGMPVYSQMIKGCYTGNYYTVGSQDTLFLISFLTGQPANQIAELNGISTTTKLTVGKSLRVR